MTDDVWIVSGVTESGDEWSMVFGYLPSKENIMEEIILDPWLREENEAGCIGCWVTTRNSVIRN